MTVYYTHTCTHPHTHTHTHTTEIYRHICKDEATAPTDTHQYKNVKIKNSYHINLFNIDKSNLQMALSPPLPRKDKSKSQIH